MRQHQCRFLQHHHLGPHHYLRFIATRTQHRHSCAQVAMCAPIVVAMLVLARDAWESCGSGPEHRHVNPAYMSYWRLTANDGPAPAPAPPAPTPAGGLLGGLHE